MRAAWARVVRIRSRRGSRLELLDDRGPVHRRPEPLETAKQLLLIGFGLGTIALAHVVLEH